MVVNQACKTKMKKKWCIKEERVPYKIMDFKIGYLEL